MRLAVVLLLFAAPAFADAVSTHERSVVELGAGVYVIRHADAPDQFPQGNTTVIVGDDAVLVVDACYLPSSAREDIAQIRRWTDKPVRWLLNTHWHYDHTTGNAEYAKAFPGLHVVAQAATAKQSAGYNPGWFERFPGREKQFRDALASGKDAAGKPLGPATRADYEKAAAGVADVARELAGIADRHPDVAFGDALDIDLGGRVVALRWLGRGNTAGDAVAWLADERVLVTGDLVVSPVPYLGGGYPVEMIDTLRRLLAFDAATYVPGHGDVLRDDAHVERTIALLERITAAVSRETHRRGSGPRNLDAVKEAVLASVRLDDLRDAFAGDDAEAREFFDGYSVDGAIQAAYAEMWPR